MKRVPMQQRVPVVVANVVREAMRPQAQSNVRPVSLGIIRAKVPVAVRNVKRVTSVKKVKKRYVKQVRMRRQEQAVVVRVKQVNTRLKEPEAVRRVKQVLIQVQAPVNVRRVEPEAMQ